MEKNYKYQEPHLGGGGGRVELIYLRTRLQVNKESVYWTFGYWGGGGLPQVNKKVQKYTVLFGILCGGGVGQAYLLVVTDGFF